LSRPRVAFVVQRYGSAVNGGAELVCRKVAHLMSTVWQVEILTTCALDYISWSNHYAEGTSQDGPVMVRRFATSEDRNIGEFSKTYQDLGARAGSLSDQEEHRMLREQGPIVPGLAEFVAQHRDDYETFFFFTALYLTTVDVLPLVADKAVLVPFAHDEPLMQMRVFDKIFNSTRSYVFSTEEEMNFLQRRFPKAELKGAIGSVAIERPSVLHEELFGQNFKVCAPYIVCASRWDLGKGVVELLDYFAKYRELSGDTELELVMLGRGDVGKQTLRNIRRPGFVTDEEKWSAIRGSIALIAPSKFESLSLTCLEAWLCERPVLVNAGSPVLVGQCLRSSGGLSFNNAEEFAYHLSLLRNSAGDRRMMGSNGRSYVEQTYSQEAVRAHYVEASRALRST
jgi:glycosyltransferase involved in cell wall biosynthesis